MYCRSAWGRSDSPMSQIGVQLTDSPYVVVNMRIMARIGLRVFQEIDKDEKRVVPCVHSVGAPLAPGRGRCPVAVQQGKVHRSFSGDARDLVVRIGLWRQRAARQEVLRAAHRVEHRAGRRLDGRAYADPGRGESAWREDLHRGGFPERVRQDQPRHADPAREVRGLEGVDGGRRYRLDQAGRERAASRHQSRRRILRRGAGDFGEDQPECDGDARRRTPSSPIRR